MHAAHMCAMCTAPKVKLSTDEAQVAMVKVKQFVIKYSRGARIAATERTQNLFLLSHADCMHDEATENIDLIFGENSKVILMCLARALRK